MNAVVARERWYEWVVSNLRRGVARDDLLRTMREQGFSEADARRCLSAADPARARAGDGPNRSPGRCDGDASSVPARIPGAVRVGVDKAELFGYADFLSDRECYELIELIRGNSYPSTVAGASDVRSPVRTSRTCDLGNLDHALVADVDRRLCRLLGISPEHAESVQGQWYGRGEHFDVHHDYFAPDTPEFERHVGDRGQRTWTAMVFLNTPQAGGATGFPRLGVRFPARAGTVLMWNNLDRDGNPNPDTLHQGLPVDIGYKAILTKWFRAGADGAGLGTSRSENEFVEARTREGFLKTRMPDDLRERLVELVRQGRARDETARLDPAPASGERSRLETTPLDDETKARIVDAVHRKAESWIGDLLTGTQVSNIRIHSAGDGSAPQHSGDRSRTVHALLCVDADLDEPWPFALEDHRYRLREHVLMPGEMLLYEGARLVHGRSRPLIGRRCATVLASFGIAGSGFGDMRSPAGSP